MSVGSWQLPYFCAFFININTRWTDH